MNKPAKIALTVLAVVIIGGGIWLGIHMARAAEEPAAPAEEGPGAVSVTTARIKSGEVSRTLSAYGNVTVQPGAMAVLSASIECRVKHLLVAPGQSVDAGAAIVEIEPSPDARLQLIDARNALAAAQKDTAGVNQRFELKLATSAEKRTADLAVLTAQTKLDDLLQRGADVRQTTLKADATGMVAKVDVQPGQLVPAGAPLVELFARGQIEVRLGVEPADAVLLRPDQPARLFTTSTDEDEAIDGTVRLITRRLNPESRLVDVFIAPAEKDALLLDSFIRGVLTVKTASGLVVPRDALVPGDKGFSIFTVADAKAIRHDVNVAIQDDKEAVITGNGLHEGDAVVVAGSLELDDNAAVKESAATTAPAEAEGEK